MDWVKIELDKDPPIQRMPGDGFTTRVWNEGGQARQLVRRHLRRRYHEGVQLAFQYWEDVNTTRAALARLNAVLDEEEKARG
jgi:hypothetical protein